MGKIFLLRISARKKVRSDSKAADLEVILGECISVCSFQDPEQCKTG